VRFNIVQQTRMGLNKSQNKKLSPQLNVGDRIVVMAVSTFHELCYQFSGLCYWHFAKHNSSTNIKV
jgi:hypothetical protein